MNMNDRKLTILKIIIDDFIDTAQPVGSRTIAKKYPIDISSATIRNEMADLEELGYLKQPHTSAGRIPSDLAYRVYVDNLMGGDGLQADQMDLIKGLLISNLIELEDVVEQAATLLSELTGMSSIITMPRFKKSRLTNFKLVKLQNSKVLMVLVTDSGVFKAVPINFIDAPQTVLDSISTIFTERFFNHNIEQIDLRKISALNIAYPEYKSIIEYLVPIMKDLFKEFDMLEHTTQGENHLYEMPEFSDVNKAKRMIALLQNPEIIKKLIGDVESEGISVRIGKELGLDEIEECSIVSSSYRVNGAPAGKIAVIGPTRMDYGKVVSVVDYIRETLSDLFSGINL